MRLAMSSKHRPLVVAVDDDPGVLEAFHLVLDDTCEILEAADGDTALALIQSRDVDLVLLDLLLPGLDGVTMMERLRGSAIDVPIVVVSGINDASTTATVMRLGAVDFIPKPFEDEALLSTVRFALGQAAQVAELNPPRQRPKILFVGCAVGTSAALASVLSVHAWTATIPASRVGLSLSPPPFSPDVVVLDVARVRQASDALDRLSLQFPLSAIVVANGPSRPSSSLRAQEATRTVVIEPASTRDLLEAIRRELRPSLGPLPTFSPLVMEVVEHVSTHVADVTLRALGPILGKSPYYVSHLFCGETGMTLKTYVNRVRVEAARQLLVETRDKLEVVASMVGFHDASHLSRLFVKYLGKRPGELRRAGRVDL